MKSILKKKKRKVKFTEVAFKLSSKQKKLFFKCCKLNRTSPNKFIRNVINNYLDQYSDQLKEDKTIHKNQLKLFVSSDKKSGTQLKINMEG